MSEPVPPFLVFEGFDLSIYETLDLIERDLEGVDVDDGCFEAFDSCGRVVHLKATGVHRSGSWVDIGETHVDRVEAKPTGAERLRELLHDHLGAIGEAMPKDTKLSDLVAKCESAHKGKQ